MPQAIMFAEWCDPCRRSKGSWLLRARLELRLRVLRNTALAPRSARRECGVPTPTKRYAQYHRLVMSSKGSSGGLGGTLERVPLGFLRVTLTWLTVQSNDGKESRNATSSHCASITLAYPYTHTPAWAQPVSLGIPCWSPRRLGEARVESFHKIMSFPEIKKLKTQTTEKKLNQNI